jgi:hypothetical protein
MFKNIIMLAVATSYIALAAPQTAALAQGVPPGLTETLEEFKERCRFEDAARGWGEGTRYVDQANIQSRQANDYRQLEQNARNNAKAASSKADQDMWNADADRYANNAKDLEEKARRDLERGKAAFAKFRAHPECTDQFKEFMDAMIFGGELRTDPWFYDDTRPMKDETRAMIEQRDQAEAEAEMTEPKIAPAPRQEKKATKKPPKIEKQKKLARVKKSGGATQDEAQSIARDVVVNVASQLILGEVNGNGHKRKKHHKAERRETMEGMAMEEFQPRRKMKNKKFKKLMNLSMF